MDDLSKPLAEEPIWADVIPIPLEDESKTVVNIAYTAAFTDTMNYFRAVVKSDERSLRVFHLTKRVIKFNAANYTAWHLRREILFHTLCGEEQAELLALELKFSKSFCEEFPKNYQIWSHRRKLIEFVKLNCEREGEHALADLRNRELEFVSQVFSLTDDDKNYHAWAHRQYIWGTLFSEQRDARGSVEEEVRFCEDLLEQDVRNNSAWSHRYFVLQHASKNNKSEHGLNFARELAYCTERAKIAISNESVYNYMRAVSKHCDALDGDEMYTWLQDVCIESDAAKIHNAPARALLVDCLQARKQNALAKQVCLALAREHDTIRQAYWEWRADQT